MPKIEFIEDHLIVEVEEGASLPTVVEDHQATIPFGCRHGSCGTCRVIVEEGMENLNPKTQAEEDLFMMLTSVGRNERLACQLKIFGNVKIRA